MDKLTEIRERLATTAMLKAKFGTDAYISIAHDYDRDVSYLLQLVETQKCALEEAKYHMSREHYMNAEDAIDKALEALTQV